MWKINRLVSITAMLASSGQGLNTVLLRAAMVQLPRKSSSLAIGIADQAASACDGLGTAV
jgi:hypothetical protein